MRNNIGSKRDNDWWTEESSRNFENLSEQDALEEIISAVQTRFNVPDIGLIRKAWKTASEAHAGQRSKYSARLVIRHLLAVSKTVAELGLDSESVGAALLHDILEDTNKTQAQLNAEFGRRITNIVSAISKYDQHPKNQIEVYHQQDILKKLFDALLKDLDNLPAAFIKLAEKYDHLRFSIQHFPYEQRKDMADEVMMGYAPLAERLGVWRLKAELEDLSFRTTNFEEYINISRQLQLQRDRTEAFLRKAVPILTAKLIKAGLQPKVAVRRKHIYSTYEKMRRKGKKFIGINDFVGIRITVDEINDCYLALGTVHELWKPIPGEMDDYIGTPKPNGYQSLHTTVVSNEGFAIEIQIRTAKMHEVAEFGQAAHWRYKDSGDAGDETLNAMLSVLQRQLESSQKVGNIEDYLRTLTDDLLQDQIHVYLFAAGNLVSGELITLPKQATPIDLAFSIKEELGNNTGGAKLHGTIEVPLDWQLNSGDRVTLLTSEEHDSPERQWFTFVKTVRAKNSIKRFAQRFPPEINLQEGLPILTKELHTMGIDIPFEDIAASTPYSRTDELIMEIGSCNLNAREVAEMLFKRLYDDSILDYWTRETLRVKNLPIPTRIIKGDCCRPHLSQDLVITYDQTLTVIHDTKCPDIKKKKHNQKIKLASLDPGDIILTVRFRVRAKDRVGLLSDLTTALSEASVNIVNIETSIDHYTNLKTIDLEIDINYLVKLIDLLHRIRLISNAEDIHRINHASGDVPRWKIASPVIRVESKLENISSPVSITQETYGLESSQYATVNQRALRKAIEKAFSLEDLVLLCADVEQELLEQGENIHLSLDMFGTTRPIGNIIFDLVQYLYRRNFLKSLIKVIHRERPKLLVNIVKNSNTE
jgi:GTP diphosphokinase / guanosine-3',5'-bis(diphosphate) 3'-diphosphatase